MLGMRDRRGQTLEPAPPGAPLPAAAPRRLPWGGLMDFLFPRSCAGCGGRVEAPAGHLCWNCLAGLPLIQLPYCAVCGDPVEGRVDERFVCYACAGTPPGFEAARSAARYRGPLRRMLQAFKYHGALWLAPDLVRLLAACQATFPDMAATDAVTYVPLYRTRQRERGYNQAALLAGGLARALGKPLLRNAIQRLRDTGTQTHLTAGARVTNVHLAFGVRRAEAVRGQRLLLVDDVMTTGATVSECARVLKAVGAARVFGLTVARG